jgi:hypothetical protein
MHVQLLVGNPQLLHGRNRHHGKGFVDLKEVDAGHIQP